MEDFTRSHPKEQTISYQHLISKGQFLLLISLLRVYTILSVSPKDLHITKIRKDVKNLKRSGGRVGRTKERGGEMIYIPGTNVRNPQK